MKRAVVLLRVSSQGQTRRAGADEGYSIPAQRDGCYRKAKQLEAEVVQEFVGPAQSASNGLYPALRDALAFVTEHGDIDYLIVFRLDRFARDELTQFAALAELRAAGVKLVSVTEQVDETPQGMLSMGILGAVNAYRSRDDARKITEGRVKKAREGGTPARAPLGYVNRKRWDGANDIRWVEVDPERSPHVQWAFQAYATGEWPLKALTEELAERGLTTRPTPKRPAGKVTKSVLHGILKNSYYVGKVVFKGIEYQGNHPPLVTPDLFDQVQQVLTAHNVAGEKQWRWEHYLKGTVFCAICGSRLIFTKCSGNGGVYDYFVCGRRHHGDGCELPYLPVHRVEHDVSDYYLRQVKLDAEQVADIEPKLIEMFRHLTGYQQREVIRCRKVVDDILGQRDQVVEDHLANPRAIPLDVLEKKQQKLSEQLKAAEKQLAAAERKVDQSEEGLRLAQKGLSDSSRTYRDADPQTRRQWNQAFFTKLYVGPKGITGSELTDEFGALLAEDLAKKLEALPSDPSAFRRRGSNVGFLVELAGLEPATSWVRSRRSSN